MIQAETESVEFSSAGETVSAWFLPGAGSDSAPGPGIVFCAGFTGTKFSAFYEPYAECLVRAGRSALMIDYRGWGESGGARGVIDPAAQVEDIRCGLTYLAARAEVDADRCGLLGMSFGGGNVVRAAALDSRVRCCIAISPVGDGGLWLRQMRREYEWYELLDRIEADRQRRVAGEAPEIVSAVDDIMVQTPERRNTNVKGTLPAGMVPDRTPLWCAEEIRHYQPYLTAGDVSPAGLLLFAVEDDPVVPPVHSRLIYDHAAEPKRMVLFPGREHYGTYLGKFDRIWHEIDAWMAVHLDPRAPQRAVEKD